LTVAYPDIDPTGVQWQPRTYFDVLDELLATNTGEEPTVIAIDGHSGSGKTALAQGLAALEPHAAVIHTDDLAWHHSFFEWGDLLVHHLLIPLREGRAPIILRPDAWIRRDRAGAITIPEGASAVFIEGVGAARRETRPLLDCVVWVHVREEVGRRRMNARGIDTPEFTAEWMRGEDAFLSDHRPWEIADVLVAGELGQPAPDGRYGNVVTAPGPARLSKQA
jgi:energy-coupling factor transporter ATP-binding protein EcfA2